MDDAAFREQFKPVYVPSAYSEAVDLQDKVIFALAELDEATANEVARKLEELEPDIPDKQLIASAHQVLSQLYDRGLISGVEVDGSLRFNLHKMTQANDGQVNPDILAPGLD